MDEYLYKIDLISIGDQFIKPGKRKDLCTVIDILKTYNSDDKLVKTEYLCKHDFMGQKVTHIECGTTVIRNRFKG